MSKAMEAMEGDGDKSTDPRPPSPEKTDVDAEDEQVERFYALVANIRAMRAMFKAGPSCDHSANGEVIQRKKRRQVENQPPWRPAFTVEDFLDTADGSVVERLDRKKARSSGVTKEEAGTEEEEEEERDKGEAVEGKEVDDAAQSSYEK